MMNVLRRKKRLLIMTSKGKYKRTINQLESKNKIGNLKRFNLL